MMNNIKHWKKRIKISLLALTIGFAGFFSLAMTDNYFEISKNLDVFGTLFRELNIYYVDDTDPGELMKTGIDAMLNSLDPYTNYIPESQMEDYKIMTTGQYGGIGAIIQQRDEYVVIGEPYKGFGADKAGLKAGDKILEIDGKSVKGKTVSDVREFLIGEPGTSLKVKVKRPGTEDIIEKTVTREEVKIKDVPYHGMLNNEVGYIKLTGFTQTASQEVKDAFNDLKGKGMKSLVFDLRGNGGGLLREAVNIVNFFIPKGEMVVSTKGKIKEWEQTHKALSNPLDTEIPITVLIDDNSASASEIVSGALQDHDRAVLVGENSFGKGLVQQPRPLSYNATLKVTVAKYYIPSGRCIQKLDYSKKGEDGKATKVPDSLKVAFKTVKNKRTVYDGDGITPDLISTQPTFSNVSAALYGKYHIFDYATQFTLEHSTIASPKEFEITEEEYNKFVEFLSGKDYSYTTETEKVLEKLAEKAKEEKYYEDAKHDFEHLQNVLEERKKNDLIKFKDEIKTMLADEIIGRYYYREGRMEANLKKDVVLKDALDILKDKEKYNGILAGTFHPESINR